MEHKLFPCLWFDGNASEAVTFYCSVFQNSKIISENLMVIIFELNDTKFMALNGGSKHQFSPANTYVITCDTQNEIDHYWKNLGKGGIYNKYGWFDDELWGSWQIVPSILATLMNNTEKAPRAMSAFMQMTKFDINKLINS